MITNMNNIISYPAKMRKLFLHFEKLKLTVEHSNVYNVVLVPRAELMLTVEEEMSWLRKETYLIFLGFTFAHLDLYDFRTVTITTTISVCSSVYVIFERSVRLTVVILTARGSSTWWLRYETIKEFRYSFLANILQKYFKRRDSSKIRQTRNYFFVPDSTFTPLIILRHPRYAIYLRYNSTISFH